MMKKLTIVSAGAALLALGIAGANPSDAATFSLTGTSTAGNLAGQFDIADAALGTTNISFGSISNVFLSVGGNNLITNENPASGSVIFGSPFTGQLSDFNTVQGSLSFLSGTNVSFANGQVVSGTNPAVFGTNTITGNLTSVTSVPEPTSTLGLSLLAGIGVFSCLKKRNLSFNSK